MLFNKTRQYNILKQGLLKLDMTGSVLNKTG